MTIDEADSGTVRSCREANVGCVTVGAELERGGHFHLITTALTVAEARPSTKRGSTSSATFKQVPRRRPATRRQDHLAQGRTSGGALVPDDQPGRFSEVSSGNCPVMRQLTPHEQYRRADQSLHALLLGDSKRSRGRLKGEGPRQQASRDLREMRSAFEALHAESILDDDLQQAGAALSQGGET